MVAHRIAGGGGLTLNVEVTGNAKGRTIIFIHGFMHCHLAWTKQLESDLADDFQLVAMDMRGHGLSEKPKDVYGDPRLWADDVQAIIDTLGLDQPVLVGWSYGGAVMSDYVAHHGEDAIGGTVWAGAVCRLGKPLVDGGFVGTEVLAPMPGAFSDHLDACVPAIEEIIRMGTRAPLSLHDRFLFLGYHMIVPTHARKGLLSRDVDNDAVVAGMRKPMLVSQGEYDVVTLPAMSRHLTKLAAHAQFSVYENTGHMVFWEEPERFNGELRQFCEAL